MNLALCSYSYLKEIYVNPTQTRFFFKPIGLLLVAGGTFVLARRTVGLFLSPEFYYMYSLQIYICLFEAVEEQINLFLEE